MGEKTCGIIAAVDGFRLLIQETSIDDREYRHRCDTQEGREAAFRGERAVTGDEVNGRVVGVSDNSTDGTSEPEQSQQQQAALKRSESQERKQGEGGEEGRGARGS